MNNKRANLTKVSEEFVRSFATRNWGCVNFLLERYERHDLLAFLDHLEDSDPIAEQMRILIHRNLRALDAEEEKE